MLKNSRIPAKFYPLNVGIAGGRLWNMERIGFWGFEWRCLKRAWQDTWHREGVSVWRNLVSFALIAILQYFLGLWPKDWAKSPIVVAIPLIVIISYLILRFLLFLILAPSKIHSEQSVILETVREDIETLRDSRRVPTAVWTFEETVDYVLNRSEFGRGKIVEEVYMALQSAAYDEKLRVWACEHNGPPGIVPRGVFLRNRFAVFKSSSRGYEEVQITSSSGNIITNLCRWKHPSFCQWQIEGLWPPIHPHELLKELGNVEK